MSQTIQQRITDLKVSGHLMTLGAGLFCITQGGGGLVASGRAGLPGVRISPAPFCDPGAVDIATFEADGWLGGHSNAALVRVNHGPAQIMITVYQDSAAQAGARQAAALPRLQVLQLGQAGVPDGPAQPGWPQAGTADGAGTVLPAGGPVSSPVADPAQPPAAEQHRALAPTGPAPAAQRSGQRSAQFSAQPSGPAEYGADLPAGMEQAGMHPAGLAQDSATPSRPGRGRRKGDRHAHGQGGGAPGPGVPMPDPQADSAPQGQANAPASPVPPTVVGEMGAHIQCRGDVHGALGQWMGEPGSRVWVEGFGIVPGGTLGAADIEYQAVLGKGWLSPWMEGGDYCGSRGMALPVLGLAVRLKGDAASRFTCRVSASFTDGTRAGPVDTGVPVAAESLAPLEAFLVEILPVTVSAPVFSPPFPTVAEAVVHDTTPAMADIAGAQAQASADLAALLHDDTAPAKPRAARKVRGAGKLRPGAVSAETPTALKAGGMAVEPAQAEPLPRGAAQARGRIFAGKNDRADMPGSKKTASRKHNGRQKSPPDAPSGAAPVRRRAARGLARGSARGSA